MALEAFRAADLGYIFRDAGILAKSGASTTYGLLATDTEQVLSTAGGSVLAQTRTLSVEAGTLGTVVVGATVSVKSPTTGIWTDYVVRGRGEEGGGAIEVFDLADY